VGRYRFLIPAFVILLMSVSGCPTGDDDDTTGDDDSAGDDDTMGDDDSAGDDDDTTGDDDSTGDDDTGPSVLPVAGFLGEAAEDSAGSSISGGHDVDGDGIDDILVGAYGNDEAGSDAGKAYLVYGGPWLVGDIQLAYAAGRFLGEASHDDAGYAVAMAGDVDGDGLGDLIVGAPGNDEAGPQAGKAYLISGPATGVTSLVNATASFLGVSAGHYAGGAVAGAGDIDGDGNADLLISATFAAEGTVYVVFGPVSGTVSLLSADARIVHTDPGGGGHGYSVASAGDVNGDGFDDIVSGAPSHSIEPFPNGLSGSAFVFLGPVTGVLETTSADAHYEGPWPYDEAGKVVHGGGDLDGDGLSEVIIGEHKDDGVTRVYYGSPTFDLDSSSPDGSVYVEDSGSVAALVPDVNGDGLDDLLVGAWRNSDVEDDAGAVFLFFDNPWGDLFESDADWSFFGSAEDEHVGEAVSGAGDVNADGAFDFLVSAPGNSESGPEAGKVYLFLGS